MINLRGDNLSRLETSIIRSLLTGWWPPVKSVESRDDNKKDGGGKEGMNFSAGLGIN